MTIFLAMAVFAAATSAPVQDALVEDALPPEPSTVF
jgi:hypothetical protein